MSHVPPRPPIGVGAVLPAAGHSRRMGRRKLLLPFAGSTVIGCTADALKRGGVDRVLLVRAPGDDDLRDWARDESWEICVNPDPSRGMLASIQEGLGAIGGAKSLEVLLICPADLPLLQPESVAKLLRERSLANASLAIPVVGETKGHPLAIAGDLIARIPDLDPEIGLRQLLLDHPDQLLRVAVDDRGTIRDVDTPADYAELGGRHPPKT